MKSEDIKQLFVQFEQASCEVNSIECWSAREICPLLGYSQWRNFLNVIDKAKASCQNAGQSLTDHFADVSKTIPMPKGAEKEKGGLLKKGGTVMVCEKGHKTSVEKGEYCQEEYCGLNIKGITASEVEIINEFSRKVQILTSVLK